MLHEFLATNRAIIIDRCRLLVAARSDADTAEHDLAYGIPVFLDQLIGVLKSEQHLGQGSVSTEPDTGEETSNKEVGEAAMQQGRILLKQGFTLEQIVRNYGDVCQSVANLALETGAPIAVGEFRTLNRCLDNAIAGAVMEYSSQSAQATKFDLDVGNVRIGVLAHELRNHLQTATLVVAAIKSGNVGIAGASGAALERSLLGMRGLLDHALAEVRVNARMPPRRERIQLSRFLEALKVSASFDARARGTPFVMSPVPEDIVVYAEPEMLAAAVNNLLQNAFKFTKHRAEVQLRAYVHNDRVLIEIEDRCGGLPAGSMQTMFLPFSQGGDDRSGLGLGLDISMRSVEANGGALTVRDVPGTGCIFTIDLPRLVPVEAM
jgi:hypothetical protein